MIRSFSLVLLLLLSGAGQSSEQQLAAFFAEVRTLEARFDQVVVDEFGSTLDRSSGLLHLERPGKFRWNYQSSDPDFPRGQQIYSDGKWITFYDPDLETATQKSLQTALDQVPTLALVQTGKAIESFFTITDFGLTDGLTWVSLKPKDENAAYQGLLLGFASAELRSIVLTDGLGNETRLTLADVRTNRDIKASTFEFTPDAGTDVIRE